MMFATPLGLLALLAIPAIVAIQHVAGRGASARVGGHDVCVGRGDWLSTMLLAGASVPDATEACSHAALLAHSLLAQEQDPEDEETAKERRRPSTYFSQIFLMAAGALFLAFNLAPTEEMPLISYMMGPERVLAMVAVSLGMMHAFVYALEFTGQETLSPDTPFWSAFLRFTVVGYAVALLISAYVLWTFGRLDGTGWGDHRPDQQCL